MLKNTWKIWKRNQRNKTVDKRRIRLIYPVICGILEKIGNFGFSPSNLQFGQFRLIQIFKQFLLSDRTKLHESQITWPCGYPHGSCSNLHTPLRGEQ